MNFHLENLEMAILLGMMVPRGNEGGVAKAWTRSSNVLLKVVERAILGRNICKVYTMAIHVLISIADSFSP